MSSAGAGQSWQVVCAYSNQKGEDHFLTFYYHPRIQLANMDAIGGRRKPRRSLSVYFGLLANGRNAPAPDGAVPKRRVRAQTMSNPEQVGNLYE